MFDAISTLVACTILLFGTGRDSLLFIMNHQPMDNPQLDFDVDRLVPTDGAYGKVKDDLYFFHCLIEGGIAQNRGRA